MNNIFQIDKIISKINKQIIQQGNEYFIHNKVANLEFNNINNTYIIKSVCNNYKNNINISNSTIVDHSCECSQAKYKIICKHNIATLYKFEKSLDSSLKNSNSIYQKLIDNNLMSIYKKISNMDYLFTIMLTNNSFNIKINNDEIFDYLISEWEIFYKILKSISKENNDSNIEVENIILLLEDFSKLFIFLKSKNETFIGDKIDSLFEIMINCNFIKININFNNNELNNVFTQEYKTKIMDINFNLVYTELTYIYSINLIFKDFIHSDDYTYLFLFRDEEKIFYKVPYTDIKQYKIISKYFFESKNLDLINSKQKEIELLEYFNINNLNKAVNNKILINIFYDSKNNLINMELNTEIINNNEITNLLNNKFGNNIKKYYSENKKTIFFKNNNEFNKFEKNLKDDDTFKFSMPSYFEKNSSDFDFNFSLEESSILFNIENSIINNQVKLDILNKAIKKEEKFMVIDEKIYLVDNFNIDKINEKLKEININQINYENNILDYKNIFLLSNKIEDSKLKKYVDKINNYQVTLKISDEIRTILKPYQLYGVKWIQKMLELFHGCILADEMGLGKTIQTLTYLENFYNTNCGQTLLIAPLTLINNWKLEIKKFNFKFKIIDLSGTKNIRFKKIKEASENIIFLTTYGQIINDFDNLNNINFKNIILDEGQRIKNYNSLISQKIRKLNGVNRLFLSGTPIENNILELWTIFDFILPNYLPEFKKFKNLYLKNEINSKIYDVLNLQINPFILRRNKLEHLPNLPKKVTNNIKIDFTQNEKDGYIELVNKSKIILGNKINTINILSLITKLRLYTCYNSLDNSKLNKSLSLTKEIINNDPENKIIIFCFFSSVLEKISIKLNEIGIENLLLTGKTKNRNTIIDSFNNNKKYKVILASLKTGGIGLNLTSANYIINYSPWWNDSSEQQAIDRAHRIGQLKTLTVYNLINEDSIETEINKIKFRKNVLIDKTINNIDYFELLNNIISKIK